jgi:hypothetical protein
VQLCLHSFRLRLYRKHSQFYDRFFRPNPRRHLTVESLSEKTIR